MADKQENSCEEDDWVRKKRPRERRDQEEDREGIAKKKAKKAQPGYKAEEMERETPNSIHLAVDVQMGVTEEPKGASSSSSSSSPPLQTVDVPTSWEDLRQFLKQTLPPSAPEFAVSEAVTSLQCIFFNDFSLFARSTLSDVDSFNVGPAVKVVLRQLKQHPSAPAPEFQYPDNFKQRQKFEFDHDQIAVDTVVGNAVSYIDQHIRDHNRPSPVMLASFSRSGKTTSLQHLFNYLVDHTEHTPLFVSFNGDSGFEGREGESDEQAFLRGFAEQISPHPPVDGMIYTRQALEVYVKKISQPVLLLDELNVIADPPQRGLASLLRTCFLDCDAYLCYTSHWGFCVTDALGYRGDLSYRGRYAVAVARSMCVEDLRRMFKDKGIVVNPSEVVYYCGNPALIYSVKRGFTPETRFKEFMNPSLPAPPPKPQLEAKDFFSQFCLGGYTLPDFRRFTSIQKEGNDERAVWPLCYAKPALYALGLDHLANLADYVRVAFSDPSTNSGLEWEYLARFALAIVGYCATFRFLTEDEHFILGKVPSYANSPEFNLIFLDETIQTVAGVWEKFKEEAKKTKGSVLACSFPQYRSFPLFDGFFAVFENSVLVRATGYQMKQRNAYPGKNTSKFRGVLLRGDPPKSSRNHRTGWVYPNCTQIQYFLPYSLRGLMPSSWLSPSSSSSSSGMSNRVWNPFIGRQ